MTKTFPATQNPAWGFYGTISHHGDPNVAWPIAMSAIADATGCADDEVRAFLDSHHGRLFADDVANGLVAGKTLADAIGDATARWMGWRIGALTSRETGIPRGLPYLTRLVTSVNVVEISVVSEVAIGQAALGGSCRVSGSVGGLSNSAMASTPM